jgi:hypothetical protein
MGKHINGKEMNALTGNKAVLLIFRSIDINALTGNAQNHAAHNIFIASTIFCNFHSGRFRK